MIKLNFILVQIIVTIKATTGCANVNITDIEINAPLNSSITPLKQLFYSTRIWQISLRIRDIDIVGEYKMCFKATDSVNQISNTECLLLKSKGISPRIIEQKLRPYGSIEKQKADSFYKFNCEYDIPIQRPTTSAIINIYTSDTNTLVYSIDSSKLLENYPVVFDNYSITFDVPSNALIPGSYYVTLDAGILS